MIRLLIFTFSLLFFIQGSSFASESSVDLYSHWRSSCSWRVRIALAVKSIDYNYRGISSKAKTGEYCNLNPLGKVPTLRIDGKVLSQSVAIIEYIDETRPEPSLYPKDPYQRSLVRQVVQMIASDIQPLQNGAVLKDFPEGEDRDWAMKWITKGLKGVEKMLVETAGVYCVGDELSAADLFLQPQLYNARLYGVDMTAFPILCRIDETLSKNPAFQLAHPEAQPDFPSNQS
ncbi:MAG: maleylacetoacetate isomerase [Chlamydiales bacterium]|jgi:maleylacetoacetate isomerase